ncbi:MAG: RimK family alpha-L-glutamate ligase [Candidatus Dojkabacteria bacterium]|nr:MAG: RimK family alpha-L-glutamate ligase [Candidatus Dojkabacteria bacterium]
MKLAIIGRNPYYESDRILYEALKRGHEAVFLSKNRIVETTLFNGGAFGIYFTVPSIEEQIKFEEQFPDWKPITLAPPQEFLAKYEKKNLLGKVTLTPTTKFYDIRYFDAFLFREIAKTLEWSTILANYLLSYKKTVVDEKIGKGMYYKSKHGTFYKASTDGFPYVKSVAAISKQMLSDILDYLSYPIIVKKSESSKGLGVFKCTSKNDVFSLLEEEKLAVSEVLVQELVDYRGDIRVFVVGDEILGAMRREPQAGQWKGNVAQGADAYPIEIDNSIQQLALGVVKAQDAEIRGVDIMLPKSGPVLIETNSAPQFQGFEKATGVNVGQKIVEYIEKKHEKLSNS